MIEAPLADEERREIQVCEDVFEPLPVGRRVLRSELFPEPRIRRTLRVRLDSAARDRNRARRNLSLAELRVRERSAISHATASLSSAASIAAAIKVIGDRRYLPGDSSALTSGRRSIDSPSRARP